jgi:hypothetical protein
VDTRLGDGLLSILGVETAAGAAACRAHPVGDLCVERRCLRLVEADGEAVVPEGTADPFGCCYRLGPMRYLDTQWFSFLTERSTNLAVTDGKPFKHALGDAYAKRSRHA